MTTMPLKILLVLPAFNVGTVLENVISKLPKHDTLLVDDGSLDNTGKIAEKLGYLVIRHASNLGLSAAIRTGEQHAISQGYTHVVLMDADGQHPPELFDSFCDALGTSDFVLGDRFTQLDDVPPQKVASNLFASLLLKSAAGKFIRDVSCGYRGYRLKRDQADSKINGYSEIYRQVIINVISGNLPSRVAVPAIYDSSQPLATKRAELLALCAALSQYQIDNTLLSHIFVLANKKSEIAVQIEGVPFWAQYFKELDSYLFSTDLTKAATLYGN